MQAVCQGNERLYFLVIFLKICCSSQSLTHEEVDTWRINSDFFQHALDLCSSLKFRNFPVNEEHFESLLNGLSISISAIL